MKKNQGISLISLLIYIAFFGVLGLLGLKLGPHYVNDYVIKEVVSDVVKEPALAGKSALNLRKELLARFSLNNIEYLSDKNIQVTENNQQKIIEISYEVRENILANLDVVLRFSHKIPIQ